MSDILARICADKREHIAQIKRHRPLSAVLEAAYRCGPARGFADSLATRAAEGEYGLIAEIKRASPSKGLIRSDFVPARIARAYQEGGATCLSVLTDTPYFEGTDDHLVAARAAVDLPVLRKDFIIDPYQIVESRALGADCILLIMAILDDAMAREFEELAYTHGMDALIEVHDEAELERALALESPLIGINNRDLKSFAIDTETTRALAPKIPAGRVVISESGLTEPEDLVAMKEAGVTCFLIGESLMREEDVAAATRRILAPAKQPAGV